MSTNQQFQKNLNAPSADSELWTVAEGWKISAKSGKIYTNLDKVFTNKVNPDSEDNTFYNTLIDQLEGKVTEPIDYIGYYFVAGSSQDGAELVYAFEKNNLAGAEKQVKYSANINRDSSVPKGPTTATQQHAKPQQKLVSTDITTSTKPFNTTAPLSTVQRSIEVVKEVIPIAWDNAMEIAKAEERGLYVLPVAHVGKENFFFQNENGERCFLYGRIINVKVGDN